VAYLGGGGGCATAPPFGVVYAGGGPGPPPPFGVIRGATAVGKEVEKCEKLLKKKKKKMSSNVLAAPPFQISKYATGCTCECIRKFCALFAFKFLISPNRCLERYPYLFVFWRGCSCSNGTDFELCGTRESTYSSAAPALQNMKLVYIFSSSGNTRVTTCS
jgi:hypothetical protein